MSATATIPQFKPDHYYLNIFNREIVQGSILNRHNVANELGWYEVTARNADSITVNVPQLDNPLTIANDVCPMMAIKLAKAKASGVKPKKARSSGKPKRTKNYAAEAIKRTVTARITRADYTAVQYSDGKIEYFDNEEYSVTSPKAVA